MAKDPAFLFYTGDFSTGTQFFDDEQLGKYLRLLMAQHQHGHLSEKQMLHICKSYDKDIFIKFDKDDNGMFFNKRLEEEINKRKAYTSSRSNNKSGRKSSKNTDLPKKEIKSYDYHMEDENKDINEIKYKYDNVLCLEILSFFKFNETANFDKLRLIGDFHKCLFVQGRLDWFTENFKSYKELKLLNPKYIHSFKNFLGDSEKLYTDGAWNLENWTEKLNIEKNGKSTSTTDAKKQSRDNLKELAIAILTDQKP